MCSVSATLSGDLVSLCLLGAPVRGIGTLRTLGNGLPAVLALPGGVSWGYQDAIAALLTAVLRPSSCLPELPAFLQLRVSGTVWHLCTPPLPWWGLSCSSALLWHQACTLARLQPSVWASFTEEEFFPGTSGVSLGLGCGRLGCSAVTGGLPSAPGEVSLAACPATLLGLG